MERFPPLAVLAEGCTAFYGLETVVLPMMSLTKLEAGGGTKIRRRRRGAQVNAADINENLKSRLPMDGFTLCAVTMADLYKGDMNYLFGLAFLTSHVGVFSFHRHQPNSPDCEFFHGSLSRQPGDEGVLLRRAFQTLTHELGHTFSLKHCVFFSCLMQGANSLEEAEGRLPDLCAVCLRKLIWCAKVETSAAVRERYERLLDFYERQPHGFERHLAWVRSRLGLAAPQRLPEAQPLPPELMCDECEPSGTPAGAPEPEEDDKAQTILAPGSEDEEECGSPSGWGKRAVGGEE